MAQRQMQLMINGLVSELFAKQIKALCALFE